MSTKQRMSVAASRLDQLMALARMASASKDVRMVVRRLKTSVDEGSLSRYRHAKNNPSTTTAATIEQITEVLGDELVVRARDWARV